MKHNYKRAVKRHGQKYLYWHLASYKKMDEFIRVEKKRSAFHKYLIESGLMDVLTKILVLLYEVEDEPEDAVEFVRLNLPGYPEKLGEAEDKIAELEKQIRELSEAPPEEEENLNECEEEAPAE